MSLTSISTFITLDVYDHDTTPETVKAIALDNDTRTISAEIQNRGVWYDVGSTADIQLIIKRPDNVGVTITGDVYPIEYESGGEIDPETGDETPVVTETYYGVTADLNDDALVVAGVLQAQFVISTGTQVLHTEIFKINNGRALDAEITEWVNGQE